MQNKVLVSCTVVSYNSAKTIIETLESIKAQTYQDIELIISDDCSKDNTVEICREWIKKNNNRFARVELITSSHNTGVSGNGNRALAACSGVWQKSIAADDKLLPNCIEDFMDYVSKHPDTNWVSSYMRSYNDTFEEGNCVKSKIVDDLSFFELSAKEQLLRLAKRNLINAPSLFFRTSFKKSIRYNEKYGFEDWPFYIDALEKGYKCFFMPKETVCYRIQTSLSNAKGKLFKYEIALKYREFERERLFKYLSEEQQKGELIMWKTEDLLERYHLNRDTPLLRFFYKKWLAILYRLYNLI